MVLDNQICNYFVLKSQKFNKLDFSLDSDISIFYWLLISEQKLSANRVITYYGVYLCVSEYGLAGHLLRGQPAWPEYPISQYTGL